MSKLLLVDDCEEISLLVEKSLHPHSVTFSKNLEEANKALASKSFDLILIDVELPDGSGYDFCNELSQSTVFDKVPRIILSAKGKMSEKVFGLYSGADDYIVKPFFHQELKARVDACLRRAQTTQNENMIYRQFQFNSDFQKCFIINENGKEDLNLTPTEYRIFYTLASNENQPFSRRDLVKEIWNKNGLNIETRGVDSHMSHLRKKLKDYKNHIVSVYGRGYAFKPEAIL
jgi:DNA-binding response OmpR family regulator